ncbi:unnamed protein product [Mycena citricolor]|uniref:Endopolyphosphatase n=1 Tax=Mycena citricolor TaxID=2018698 RepID=A0AAD2GVJ4_9AGAR|nr:unnamed protein product [Mycena citricolor]
MFFSPSLLLLLCLDLLGAHGAPTQEPFQVPNVAKPRKLRGNFLHITDIHPDPAYRPKTSEATSCHRKKGKKKKNVSGLYGVPYSGCDSPFSLINHTLDFIEKKWASEIDFVVWTGDNARFETVGRLHLEAHTQRPLRHDNDRKLPRTPKEIYDLNRGVASKMTSIFTSRGIPVIPSIGNNDVWPHVRIIDTEAGQRLIDFKNIMLPGPSSTTNEFASIWKNFIPFQYLQIFQRGAYYAVEVVPDSLAVVSLNTMYFYHSNKAVSGCSFKERDDAGNLEFDWLEVQLKGFRARGMQVWLTGHVPPSIDNYHPECYVRYTELALRFQDTILGHLYGHMNADHFFFLEASDLSIIKPAESQLSVDLFDSLVADFASMPKAKKMNLDDYAVINVSPAVVPNPYLPSFRIFSYNTTGPVQDLKEMLKKKKKKEKSRHPRGDGNKTELCKMDQYRDTWKCHLNEPWHSDPDSPSRRNRLWTPLGYAQYYIPHLEEANKTHAPKFKLEYLTYKSTMMASNDSCPVPLKNLPKELKKRHTAYGMSDLTVGAWIGLARKLGEGKSERLRVLFKEWMYMGAGEDRD